jgi:RNA binding exosome subunit
VSARSHRLILIDRKGESDLKGAIQSVEVSYLVHMTEDQRRLASAVKSLVASEAEPEAQELEGHFGNKIVAVRLRLTGEDAAGALHSISKNLPWGEMKALLGSLGDYVDEHAALFLRFDKQRLVEGTVAMGTADAVKVKVKPRAHLVHGGAVEFYGRLLREND